jgi:hypothetical protein
MLKWRVPRVILKCESVSDFGKELNSHLIFTDGHRLACGHKPERTNNLS